MTSSATLRLTIKTHSLFAFLLFTTLAATAQQKPLRVGIIGLTHTHVHGILGRENRGDIQIVGIVEPNKEVAARYTTQYHLPMSMVYNTMEELIAATHPEAVTAFNTTYEHLKVVENNMVVMEILDAARLSAKKGKAVKLRTNAGKF